MVFRPRGSHHKSQIRPTTTRRPASKVLDFGWGFPAWATAVLPDQPTVSLLAGSLRFRLGQWCPSGGMLMIIGVLLAVAAVVVPVGWMACNWYAGPWSVKRLPPWSDRAADSAAPADLLPGTALLGRRAAVGRRVAVRRQRGRIAPAFDHGNSAFGPHGSPTQTSAPSSSSEPSLRESLRRLPGAAALALPEVVRELQLTAEQQKQIRQLIEATSQAMRDLDHDCKASNGSKFRRCANSCSIKPAARRSDCSPTSSAPVGRSSPGASRRSYS